MSEASPEPNDSFTPANAGAVDPQRILIVRPSALGDVCRTVPALVTLRRRWPLARIDWMVSGAFAEAVRHHPALNNVIDFPRRRFATLWRSPTVFAEAVSWIRKLRRQRYDLVIDLQGLLRSGLITRLTGAPRRVGYTNAREGGWLGYNLGYPVDANRHTVDRMLGLLDAIGCPLEHDMRLYLGTQDQAWLDAHRAEHIAPAPGGAYACLAPMAKWRCKCWPIKRYIEIARRLLERGIAGEHLIIIAAPDEVAHIQPLLDAFANDRRVSMPGTTIGQMMALIAGADLVVCNDSAPMHMAVGFDRRLVAVFAPTNPALGGPYDRPECVVHPANLSARQMTHHHHHDPTLIRRVSVDAVWEKILEQCGQ